MVWKKSHTRIAGMGWWDGPGLVLSNCSHEVMTLFIDVMALIRGLVLRLVVSLIVHATQIVYIMGLWSGLKMLYRREF